MVGYNILCPFSELSKWMFSDKWIWCRPASCTSLGYRKLLFHGVDFERQYSLDIVILVWLFLWLSFFLMGGNSGYKIIKHCTNLFHLIHCMPHCFEYKSVWTFAPKMLFSLQRATPGVIYTILQYADNLNKRFFI